MRNTSLRRGVHLGVAALLALTATLVGACGKDGGITDPGSLDPPDIPSEDTTPSPQNLRRLAMAKAPSTMTAAPVPGDPRTSCPGA
jgi:hypothetical protein